METKINPEAPTKSGTGKLFDKVGIAMSNSFRHILPKVEVFFRLYVFYESAYVMFVFLLQNAFLFLPEHAYASASQ